MIGEYNTVLLFRHQCITGGVQCSPAVQIFKLVYYQGGAQTVPWIGRISISLDEVFNAYLNDTHVYCLP